MKKLNRKGFTLVELLAVIIILAIVVGITIPAVLTTTQKAKEKAFQTAADTAADWFDRQYQVALTGLNGTGIATLDSNFSATSGCGSNGSLCTYILDTDPSQSGNQTQDGKTFTSSSIPAIFAAAGLKTSNVESMKVVINSSTGRSCVTLTAADDGDYAGIGTEKTNDNGTPADTSDDFKYYIMTSSNCQIIN